MAKRARRKRKAKERASRPTPPPPTFLESHWRAIASVVVIVLVLAGATYAVNNLPWGDGDGNGSPPADGDGLAPVFHLTSVDGEPVDLDAHRGQVVVLDLFATWCGPCAVQMDHLNELRAHYPASQVVILSIDIDPDNPSETVESVRDFRDQHHAEWQFMMDDGTVNDNYGTGSIPTLVIIDRDGHQAWRHAGVATFDDLAERIEGLL